MQKKVFVIVFTSILSCFFLYFVERILLVNYETKTISKVLLFTLIPILYWKFYRNFSIKKTEKKKNFLLSILLSITTFSVIWIGYILFGKLVNFYSIKAELGLSANEFLLRGIYIILGNSFLEEFFFRGFIFLNLYQQGLKKFAYIFSSVLFAVYHIAMFQSWFPLPIMLLVLFSLFVVGVVFNYLCRRVSSFRGSWVVHASSDLAIISIGLNIFYM